MRTPQNTLDFRSTGRVNGNTRFSRSALLAGSAPTTSLNVVSEYFTELLHDSLSGRFEEQKKVAEEGLVVCPGNDDGCWDVMGSSEGEHNGSETPYSVSSKKEANTGEVIL